MQFERVASVSFQPFPGSPALPFKVQGLRTEFSIKKTLEKTGNTASITIYNLSKATRERIKELQQRIVLSVGYSGEGNTQVIMDHDITLINHAYEPPEVVTKIDANGRESEFQHAFINLTYGDNVKAQIVFDEILKTIDIPPDVSLAVTAQLKNKKFTHGFAHIGSSKDALTKLCNFAGLEYSVQDGKLRVLKGDHAFLAEPPKTIILVSPASGLIGSPERFVELKKDQTTEKKPPGWKFKCLLQPNVVPGDWIALQSREIERPTAYKVLEVEHKGDTHGQDWTSEIKVADPGVLIEIILPGTSGEPAKFAENIA